MFTGHYFIVMLISNFIVLAEKHFSNGRIDCVIETPLYIYIIEFKLNSSVKEALRQIQDKDYATPYMAKDKKMAQWKFSGDKHKSLQVYTERTFHQRYLLVML